MSMLDGILEQVRKTNPEMTYERLLNELRKSTFSAKALMIINNVPKEKQDKP